MDTKTFLETILPDSGIYFLMVAQGKFVRHKSFDTIEELADKINELKDIPHFTLYHACASFRERSVPKAGGGTECRTTRNSMLAKSFWLDIDVGEHKLEKKKGYPTKRDAANAVGQLCKTIGLPTPMIVDSGGGIHVYWPLTEAVPVSQWRVVAINLRNVMRRLEIHADHTATKDSARVLRPVGSFNRKPNRPVRTVKCLTPAKPISFEQFEASVNAAMDELGIFSAAEVAEANQDIIAHTYDGPSIPAYATEIATKCQQIKVLAETQGDVSYEIWRAGVGGIAKHCVEGEQIAQQWTLRRHEKHEQTDYEKEMRTWEMPPPTCAHFAEHEPDGCAGCPHQGKIKSPIVLGYKELDMSEQANESGEVEVSVSGSTESTPVFIPVLPKGYAWIDNKLCRSVENTAEERIEQVPFCDTLLYATTRIKNEDGSASLLVAAHMPREGICTFLVECASLYKAVDGCKILASRQIFPTHNKGAAESLMAYLRAWLDKLKVESDEQKSYSQFGWDAKHENFVMGNLLYTPGEVREIMPGKSLRDKLHAFRTDSDLAVWVESTNDLYNHPNDEWRQYCIATTFGSILTPFCSDSQYHGMTLAVTGPQTAKGKTTTIKCALSAFAAPEELTIAQTEGATINARYARMAQMQNIPILMDEVTHIELKDLSQLCYAASMGKDKDRMKSTNGGTEFATTNHWATTLYLTANTTLHDLMSTYGVNSAAEAVRLIEIRADQEYINDFSNSKITRLVSRIVRNHTAAGDVFVRYVVNNRQQVEDIMDKWSDRVSQHITDAKMRNFRSHAECTMAALEICNKLDLLRFDTEAVFGWAMRMFKHMVDHVTSRHYTSPEDMVSAVLNSLSGHIATTDFYKDSRNANPDRVFVRDGIVKGRMITGGGNDSAEKLAGRLYLSRRAIKQWCVENRAGEQTIIDEIKRMGMWIELGDDDKFVLGRGTTLSTGQDRCICINYRVLEEKYGHIAPEEIKQAVQTPSNEKVVEIKKGAQ